MIKKQFEYSAVAALLAALSFQVSLFWKHDQINIIYGWGIALVVFCIAYYGRTTLRRALPVFCIAGAMLLSQRIAGQFPDAPEWRGITAFLWHGSQEPRLRVLWGAALNLAYAWALVPGIALLLKRVKKISFFQQRKFLFACVFVCILTLYSSMLVILRHRAFLSTAFDFSIFDQALFQFSRFTAPVSTARQFTNLFFDHQHFSIVLLAPVYWVFRGFHGIVLAGISSWLLIAFPSILLGLAVRELTQKTAAWVVLLSALILFFHPFTQASLTFEFHEKFLIPVLCTGALYFLARYVRRRKVSAIVLSVLCMVGWMLAKEDQWIFVVVATIQVVVHTYIWSKQRALRIAMVIWAESVSALALAYLWILRMFASHFNPKYGGMYTDARIVFTEVVHSGNVTDAVSRLHLFNDARLYLYQHFFSIDFIGLFAFPLNIIGEYAERILNGLPNISNPFYHYGVLVPIYVVIGVVSVILIIERYTHKQREEYIAAAISIIIGGLCLVTGWNGLYYLHTIPQAVARDFVNTHNRRAAFWDTVKVIPADSSVVAAEGYSPQLSARQQIIRWPDEVHWPAGTPGKVDMLSYEYWVLPPRPFLKNDATDYQTQIDFLQTQGYSIIAQNEFVVILKK